MTLEELLGVLQQAKKDGVPPDARVVITFTDWIEHSGQYRLTKLEKLRYDVLSSPRELEIEVDQ